MSEAGSRISIAWTAAVATFLIAAALAVALVPRVRFATTVARASSLTCDRKPGAAHAAAACYEALYGEFVAARGVEGAFAELRARYSRDTTLERLCHAVTHHIGQAGYRRYGTIAAAFAHGDPFCGGGYYHGVLEGYAETVGMPRLLERLDAACAAIPGKDHYSLDYYNCVHGLGHGLMAVTQDRLYDALAACDRLTGRIEQSACANGVFMENLVMDGEHGGHFSKYLKPDDPLYPCTEVEARHKAACFDVQTSYALGAVGGNFTRVFALCADQGAPYRTTCYRSLGRDASTLSRSTVPATVAACNLGADVEQRANCIDGAVMDFVYYYHSDVQAHALCAALTATLQNGCRDVAERVMKMF